MKILIVLFLACTVVDGATITEILNMNSKTFLSLEEVYKELENYDIIILGENHDNEIHHQTQLNILKNTFSSTPKSVGFEFVDFDQNEILNRYSVGKMSDEDFQNAIGWGGVPFEFFKPLFLYPPTNLGMSVGINVPRRITGKISRTSLQSLTLEEQRKYIPPAFELGNQLYRDRFKDIFKEHPIPEKDFENYFTAQSLWDDSMAYQSDLFLSSNPNHKLFIIVGNFHVEYGIGLRARIAKRIPSRNTIHIVQIDENHYTESELQALKQTDSKFGNLADIVIFSK